MKDLENKCKNEKYFQSIRFYYHRLPSESKLEFILEVAEVNIYLASQCIMSDSTNERIEKRIQDLAILAAECFSDADKSTYGLMAMAEFGQYDLILGLFESIDQPSKSHIRILNKVFSEVELSVFIRFIDTLSHYKNIGLLLSSFASFKGSIALDQDNIEILKRIVQSFLDRDYTGFLKMFFNKYELWRSANLLFGNKLEDTIRKQIKGSFSAVHFAYLLTLHNNFGNIFPTSVFMDAFGKHSTKKSLSLAFKLAAQNDIYNNTTLNGTLRSFLMGSSGQKTKQNVKKMRYLLNNGLKEYVEKVPELVELIAAIDLSRYTISIKGRIELPKRKPVSASDINVALVNPAALIFGAGQRRIDVRNNYTIDEYWSTIFSFMLATAKNVSLEKLIIECTQIYNIDFKEVCRILRKFEHFGEVEVIKDHGCYVLPMTFHSTSGCFLYRPISDRMEINLANLEIGDVIMFIIIGFKEETQRINIQLII